MAGFGYILKVAPTNLLDVGGKNKRVKDNFKLFGMSNWTDGIDIYIYIYIFFFFERWLTVGETVKRRKI